MTMDDRSESRSRPVSGFLTLLAGLVLGIGVLLGLTAGVGAIWSGVTAPGSAAEGAGQSASGEAGNVVDLVIKDVATPEGSEPAYVGPSGVGAAALFTATAGERVTIVVRNEDAMPHTFTSPGLGLNVSIGPGGTTTFAFVAKSAGTYPFDCAVPCGSWVMSHTGYMQGDVKVVA
ncbi:MAG TPA: cupredoxin domain-containing protein [Acidimicrobiales bacterium]|nr:cupredoxin domain-containing protein [Acidimicrobiales bacterium]